MEKANLPWKHFAAAFALSLVVYVGAYSWIEHRRNFRGPWEVEFIKENSQPAIRINQHALGITNVVFLFTNTPPEVDTDLPVSIRFTNPPKPQPYDIPFGRVIFLDTTFLPGTTTLELFGNRIELIPRTLNVNEREYEWSSDLTMELGPRDPLPLRPKK